MDNLIQTSSNRGSAESLTLLANSISNIENGSFEEDFRDWNTIGDSSIESNDLGIFPTDGTYQALITTGYSDAGGSVEDADLEEFLDLAAGSLDGLVSDDAFEGSAIKQTIDLEVGDVVSFDWNFVTDENTPDATFNDTAFLSVNGFTFELADTNANFVDASNVDEFNEQTGTQTLTFSVGQAGTYSLGFGVVDVGDANVDSGLIIDNIVVQPSSNANSSSFNLTGTSSSSPDLILGDGGFSSAMMPTESESGLVLGENGFETL